MSTADSGDDRIVPVAAPHTPAPYTANTSRDAASSGRAATPTRPIAPPRYTPGAPPGRPTRQPFVPGVRGGVPAERGVHAPPRGPRPETRDVTGRSSAALGQFGDFAYRGGPVLAAPAVYACFAGAAWADRAHQALQATLISFLTDFLGSPYMNVLTQYGVGTGTLAGTAQLGAVAANVTDANIQALVQTAINTGAVPPPLGDGTRCYVLFLDENTAVQDAPSGLVLCEPSGDTAFGYHSFFATSAGPNAYYAVIPALTTACVTESCPGGDSTCSLQTTQSQLARITQVVSHEVSEMASDPHLNAWFGAGGENGDLCNGISAPLVVGANTWNVQAMYSKFDDVVNGTPCVTAPATPRPDLVVNFGHAINDGRPFWTGDFDGDGKTDVLFYYPGDDNWWLGTSLGGLLQWRFAGNTAGFGNGINDGRPFWTGRFSDAGRDEVLFYYPGDDNWWLGRWDGGQLAWQFAGNTAGFGHAIDDGRPFWTGDFDGDGRTEVLFYYPGDDNWWLGRWDGGQLAWQFAGNTGGFGHGINDGRPFFTGRFSDAALDQILFYYPGDDNWWLGTWTGQQLTWQFAGNTAGFGNGINDGRPFWTGDFNGDGRTDVLFYYPGDDNWWLGTWSGGQLAWQLAGNTAGFGHAINDGRPFWTGRFSTSVRDDMLFYFPGDDNWWVGSWDGGQLAWTLAGNTSGFGHAINDGRPFWTGGFAGDGQTSVLFYFPGDDNWWAGMFQGTALSWGWMSNTGGYPAGA